jgi:hypothetical protein
MGNQNEKREKEREKAGGKENEMGRKEGTKKD